jgi:hypothetical protein
MEKAQGIHNLYVIIALIPFLLWELKGYNQVHKARILSLFGVSFIVGLNFYLIISTIWSCVLFTLLLLWILSMNFKGHKRMEYTLLPSELKHKNAISKGKKVLIASMIIDHFTIALAIGMILYFSKYPQKIDYSAEFVLFSKCYAVFKFLNCWILTFAKYVAYIKWIRKAESYLWINGINDEQNVK